MLRFRFLSLACLFAVLMPAAASAKPLVGISDNSTAMFADPLFTGLGVKQVRLVVSYNVVAAAAKGDNELSDKDTPYINSATAQGIDVMVAFEHGRGDAHGCKKGSTVARCKLPSVAEYSAAIKSFLTVFPQVHTISAWNEANDSTQPTRYNPKRAGQYAKAVDSVCAQLSRSCTNIVMDALDTADNTHAKHLKYTRTAKFIKAVRKGYGKTPAVCGIHNYADVNRFRTAGTKALTKAMRCKHYWLTETGGIYRFGSFWTKSQRKVAHCSSNGGCQAKALKYLFSHTIKAAKHIDRVYVYDFYSGPVSDHDWGMTKGDGTHPNGVARPEYNELKKHVATQRVATAAKACSSAKYPGEGYFTSLAVKHAGCGAGRKLELAHYGCRTKHGKLGRCKHVSGYTCSEKRESIPTETDSRVKCSKGSKRVTYTYQQNTQG